MVDTVIQADTPSEARIRQIIREEGAAFFERYIAPPLALGDTYPNEEQRRHLLADWSRFASDDPELPAAGTWVRAQGSKFDGEPFTEAWHRSRGTCHRDGIARIFGTYNLWLMCFAAVGPFALDDRDRKAPKGSKFTRYLRVSRGRGSPPAGDVCPKCAAVDSEAVR